MNRSRKRVAVGLDTTVMVDVLFILLIFFIVVSQIRTSQIDLELPRVDEAVAREAPQSPESSPLLLSITRSGELRLDGRPISSIRALRSELGRQVGRNEVNSRRPVLVRTDEGARSGTLVEVLGALSEAGLETVRFDVDPVGGDR